MPIVKTFSSEDLFPNSSNGDDNNNSIGDGTDKSNCDDEGSTLAMLYSSPRLVVDRMEELIVELLLVEMYDVVSDSVHNAVATC